MKVDILTLFPEICRAPLSESIVKRARENGIVDLPPAPFDPVPFATAGALLCVGLALGAGYLDEKRRR